MAPKPLNLLNEHTVVRSNMKSNPRRKRSSNAVLRVAVIVVGETSTDSASSSIFANNNNNSSQIVVALRNPVSTCKLARVVFLSEESPTGQNPYIWCRQHQIDAKEVRLSVGRGALDNVLEDDDIDAVYFAGMATATKLSRATMAESALRLGKHVLVDGPISQSVDELASLLRIAHENNCHLQDTTVFIHHHAVQQFLDCVLEKETFGSIQTIETTFDIHAQSEDYVHLFQNTTSSGCIGTLCRYCALLGVTVFLKEGRRPVSARVLQSHQDDDGSPLYAECRIDFDGGRSLTVDCSYVNYQRSRQAIDVHSSHHTASMSNFVFQNHSLSCYRLYEIEAGSGGKEVVKCGESVDIVNGPVQEAVLWRRFAEFSREMDEEEEKHNHHCAQPRRNHRITRSDLSRAAIQTQTIVMALLESFQNDGAEVVLSGADLVRD